MSKRRRSLLIGAIAALLTGCNGNGGVAGSPPALPYTSAFPVAKLPVPAINRVHRTSASGKIQHVVIIIQENRAFNNLFYGFPGAKTVKYGYNSSNQKITLQPVPL